jgi:hypothetical protein
MSQVITLSAFRTAHRTRQVHRVAVYRWIHRWAAHQLAVEQIRNVSPAKRPALQIGGGTAVLTADSKVCHTYTMGTKVRFQMLFERRQLIALRKREKETGSSVAEIVRRAVDAYFDASKKKGKQ